MICRMFEFVNTPMTVLIVIGIMVVSIRYNVKLHQLKSKEREEAYVSKNQKRH